MLKFRRRGGGQAITIFLEGKPLRAFQGDTVAAALLQQGICSTRETVKYGCPRAPYCLMGSCFECLMVIDGIPNRQACLVTVREGMTVKRQDILHGSHWA